MKKELRPYQAEIVSKLKKRLKEVTHPLLVTASVGSGKSLMIAEILLWLEQAGYRALCLTLNSTLIQQNAEAYKGQGGHCGIYAASIKSKETEPLIIFGSPQSVCNGIRNQEEISECRFNAIIIDEAHNFNHLESDTMYQRIVHHFGLLAQSHRYSYRVIGLTGTPFRGKGNSIIGDDQFFREEVCNISASWLINEGYLTKPVFGLPQAQGYDFSKIRVNSMGKFSGSELQAVIDANARLTGQIMMELQEIMKNRVGAFVFAATKRHCEECARGLPEGEWAIVTGDTPHEQRKEIIEKSKAGIIKYLINVNCLVTGVDISSFDVCCWCRPTESLVLYTQGIGRVLRLHEGKISALVLDYAGNLLRHGDIDDPIINEALQPTSETEKDYVIPCLSCGVLNCTTARRCVGVHNGRRCDNYFEWKDCEHCGERNDQTSRQCRACAGELIDPNAKLSLKPAVEPRVTFDVIQAKYYITDQHDYPCINAMFQTKQGLNIYESFGIKDERMRNIAYGMWVKPMVKNSSQYYPVLQSIIHLRKMLNSGDVKTPYELECKFTNNRYQIVKRRFHNEE